MSTTMTDYHEGLKEAALEGLRRDLSALADTAGRTGGVLSAPMIGLAVHELEVALAEVTAERYPDPADYATAVALAAIRVTAQFTPQRASPGPAD
jgi:hypothetical protein